MAEFTEVLEVLKQKQKMCDYLADEYGTPNCDCCPICSDNNGYNLSCSPFTLKYLQEAEKLINDFWNQVYKEPDKE